MFSLTDQRVSPTLITVDRFFMLMLCAALTGGCSTFERDWQAAAGELTATNRLTGRWQGQWRSETSGHTGNLRCIITTRPDATYHARYHATYARILTFEYAVPFSPVEDNGQQSFTGEADLGFLSGGVYQYEATVNGDDYHSTYRSKHDHGVFEMTRVTR